MTDALDCAAYRAWVVEALRRTPGEEPEASLRAHAATCDDCREASVEFRATWETVGQLARPRPSAALQDRTRRAVLRLMAEERAPSFRWRKAIEIPLAVTSALLVTAATLALLGGLVWGSTLPRGHVFFCAAMFTGLLVGAFAWIYSASTVDGVHLDAAARIGVLALAITVAATTACPELHVLSWWDRSAAGQLLTDLLGPGGSSLVFGFGYGLFPGFLAALFGGRVLATRPVANGLVAAAVVMLLATPVVYLQSAPFTSGVLASWLAGAAAGTVCGVFGAFHVRRRVTLASVTT